MKKLCLGVGLTLVAVVAHATVINPGAAVAPNAVASAVGLGSTALITISGDYEFNGIPPDIAGSYVETAYADTTNPFNTFPGVYDTTFVLSITIGKGTATVERATLGYFGGFETSVSYLSSSDAAPIGATRDILGSVIGYNFAGLTPGQLETLVVYTNAQGAYAAGAVSIQNGTAGYNTGLSPVPEPAVAALTGVGLILFGLIRGHKENERWVLPPR